MQGVEFSGRIRPLGNPIQQLQGTVGLSLLQEPAGHIGHQFIVREVLFSDPFEVVQEPFRITVHAAHQTGSESSMSLSPTFPVRLSS